MNLRSIILYFGGRRQPVECKGVLSCLLGCALLCSAIYCPLRAEPAAPLSFPWLSRQEWKGKAEIARYSGTVVRYRQKRPAELVLITVLEPFNLKQMVKSETGKNALLVLKQNQVLSFQTGVYPYRQMNSVFWKADSGRLLKISMTSQEWCGQSFKEARLYPDHIQLSYNSYWEGEGRGYHRTALPRVHSDSIAFLYDELPLIVRSPKLRHYKKFHLFPLLMSSQVLRPDFDIGKPTRRPGFSMARLEFSVVRFRLASQSFSRVQRISLRFADPVQKNQDVFYVHQKGPNRVLLGWDRHDGGRFRLQELYYTDYWNQNGKGKRLTGNQIKTLAP